MDIKVINLKKAVAPENVELTLDRHSAHINGRSWEEVCYMVDLRDNGRLIGRNAQLDYSEALNAYYNMLEDGIKYNGYKFTREVLPTTEA